MDRKLTPPPDTGLTLIELLVVVAVLSVLAVGVSITALRGSGSRLGEAADMAWFQAQFEQYRTLSLTSRHTYGMEVNAKDLRIARRTADGWEQQTNSGTRRWRGTVSIANMNPGYELDRPDIVILGTGRTSSFDIAFGAKHRCSSDGWTGLTCVAF